MATRIKLSDDDGLKAGDRIDIYVKTAGPTILRALQVKAIEDRLDADPRLDFLHIRYDSDDPTAYVYECFVVNPGTGYLRSNFAVAGVVITWATIKAIIAGVSIVALMITGYRISREVEKQVIGVVETAARSIKAAGAAVLGFFAVKWLIGRKK